MEEYDKATALHYSSFRPPLHAIILNKVIAGEHFDRGLDVGCGTGYSSIALTEYCSSIIGIDPSQDMLREAKPHKNISYLPGSGDDLPVGDHSVDMVTFAGSLYYCKSQLLVNELKRVCKRNAIVIVYDFQVMENDVLSLCGINTETVETSYDFEINFSDVTGFSELFSCKESTSIVSSAKELAHLLLGSSINYAAFVSRYHVDDPFDELVDELEMKRDNHSLNVNLYYSKYMIYTE